MLSHTREMIFLEDGEMVVFTEDAMQVTDLAGAAGRQDPARPSPGAP